MDKVYIGQKMSDLDIGEKSTKISRVNILVDDEHQYTAGDDSGRTLEKTIPWGSQAMANSILAAIKNYEYQPFAGTEAIVDPAAEIGDAVTVGGVYSVLVQKDISNGKLTTMDISAPSTDEIEDEYPYQSRQLRQQQREIARTRSAITKTQNSIDLKVEEAVGDLAGQITLEVTNGTDSSKLSMKIGETTITSPEIKFSSVGEISMSVTNGGTSSTLSLTIGGTTITSPAIEFSGLVTIESLKDGGTTEIDGSRITTGTISAERLNLSGALTFDDFDETSKTNLNNAAGAASTATSALDGVKALANGTFEQEGIEPEDTFINKTQIRSAEIIGGVIRAPSFTDLDGNSIFGIEATDTATEFSFGMAGGGNEFKLASGYGSMGGDTKSYRSTIETNYFTILASDVVGKITFCGQEILRYSVGNPAARIPEGVTFTTGLTYTFPAGCTVDMTNATVKLPTK